MARCFIIEDEADRCILDVMRNFEQVARVDAFSLIFLGNPGQIPDLQRRLSGIVTVYDPEFAKKHATTPIDLARYLADKLEPGDLLIVDLRLKEYRKDFCNGMKLLSLIVSELETSDTSHVVLASLGVVVVSQWPEDFMDGAGDYATLLQKLSAGIEVLHKGTPEFNGRCTQFIDAWRVQNRIQGKAPGPSLSAYLGSTPENGQRSPGVRSRTLVPYFQPIVHLVTGKILAYEVLCRDRDTKEFPWIAFKDAEHLSGSFDAQMNMAALGGFLQFFRRADERCKSLAYSLNVSPNALLSREFRATFLEPSGDGARLMPRPQLWSFEVLEADMERFEDLKNTRTLVHKMSYGFGIDDHGVRGASLQRVLELRPDYVKVDRAIVERSGDSRDSETVMSFLQLLSEYSKVQGYVIAEGLEKNFNAGTIRRLVDVGILYGQCYRLGVPSSTPRGELDAEGKRALREAARPRTAPSTDQLKLD